jgi:putative ABC transport system permease protein
VAQPRFRSTLLVSFAGLVLLLAVVGIYGLVVGLAGAIAVARAMRELPFNVEPADPVTFIAMPVLLGAVALVACIVPARRALDVEPANALRAE